MRAAGWPAIDLGRGVAVVLLVVTVGLAAVTPIATAAPDGPAAGAPPVDGRLLVRWAPEADEVARQDALERLGIEGVAPRARLGPRSEAIVVPEVVSTELADLAAELASDAAVDLAEPDQIVSISTMASRPMTAQDVMLAAEGGPRLAGTTPPLAQPNDPLFDQQWGLHNTGQVIGQSPDTTVGVAGIDVRVLDAWQVTRADPQVQIAVIDTLVDGLHQDLAGAVHQEVSTLEDPAVAVVPGMHGTAVAGVAAARADDAFGIAGVAPQAGLVSVAAFAVLDDGAIESSMAAVIAALDAAVTAGADVIVAAWTTGVASPMLRTTVEELPVPLVASAGNDGATLHSGSTVFPAGYDLPHVVSVTAVGPRGAVPDHANLGREVIDVGAPGVDVLAPVLDDQHAFLSGTSLAAPHVAGALALARAAAPYATAAELVDAVSWTSVAHEPLDGVTRSGGMLDAGRLVEGIQRPVCRPDRWQPAPFLDVGDGNVHRAGIDCLAGREVATGWEDGTFRPAASVTRAQLASFLARVVDEVLDLPPAPSAGFPDVADTNVHAPAIDRLAGLGIITAGTDGRFRPAAPVTRGQAASLLARTYGVLAEDDTAPSRAWYLDVEGSVHADAIDRVRDLGIVSGVDRTRFDADTSLRRDQMASVLARMMDALGREGVGLG